MNLKNVYDLKCNGMRKQISFISIVFLSFLLITSIFIPVISSEELSSTSLDGKPAKVDTSPTTTKKETNTPSEPTTTTKETSNTDSAPKETSTQSEPVTTTKETSNTDSSPKETNTPSTTTTSSEETSNNEENNNSTSLLDNAKNENFTATAEEISSNKPSINDTFNSYKTDEDKSLKIIKANVSVVKNDNASEMNKNEVTIESSFASVDVNTSVSVSTKTEEQTQSMIQQVDFTVSNNQNNVKLTIKNLESKPDEVVQEINISTPNKKLFKYVDIKLTANDTYIGETGIKSMTFTFSVEKTWIENESIDKHSVHMIRYHNHTWQQLNTTYVNETETHIFYQAETPGLSVFAVVGDSLVEDSGSIVDGTTYLPWYIPFLAIVLSTTLLVVVLVKKRYIYFK